jgi:hypothetical protein
MGTSNRGDNAAQGLLDANDSGVLTDKTNFGQHQMPFRDLPRRDGRLMNYPVLDAARYCIEVLNFSVPSRSSE